MDKRERRWQEKKDKQRRTNVIREPRPRSVVKVTAFRPEIRRFPTLTIEAFRKPTPPGYLHAFFSASEDSLWGSPVYVNNRRASSAPQTPERAADLECGEPSPSSP
jgi:hypothetical protein